MDARPLPPREARGVARGDTVQLQPLALPVAPGSGAEQEGTRAGHCRCVPGCRSDERSSWRDETWARLKSAQSPLPSRSTPCYFISKIQNHRVWDFLGNQGIPSKHFSPPCPCKTVACWCFVVNPSFLCIFFKLNSPKNTTVAILYIQHILHKETSCQSSQ